MLEEKMGYAKVFLATEDVGTDSGPGGVGSDPGNFSQIYLGVLHQHHFLGMKHSLTTVSGDV